MMAMQEHSSRTLELQMNLFGWGESLVDACVTGECHSCLSPFIQRLYGLQQNTSAVTALVRFVCSDCALSQHLKRKESVAAMAATSPGEALVAVSPQRAGRSSRQKLKEQARQGGIYQKRKITNANPFRTLL